MTDTKPTPEEIQRVYSYVNSQRTLQTRELVCQRCGAPFTGRTPWAKWCSTRCHDAAAAQRRRAEKKAN